METIECIKSRRSIRRYQKNPIPEGLIRELIDAATCAPSSGNIQDWEFIVVRNSTAKTRLREACGGQRIVEEAPALVVICSDRNRIGQYGSRGEELYSIQNTAAAAENLMLAAWDRGIGSCWVGAFDETEVSNILVLPSHVKPLLILALGYPAEKPERPKRWGLDEVLRWERYE